MKPNRIQISAQIESGLRGSFVMLRRASSINSTCVCTLILFITVSRRAVNRDYDDRARHRERSRSRSVSGRGGTSGRGRNFARKWLAAVLSFPPISFPRQRVRCAGRSWWKVFQRLIFER